MQDIANTTDENSLLLFDNAKDSEITHISAIISPNIDNLIDCSIGILPNIAGTKI